MDFKIGQIFEGTYPPPPRSGLKYPPEGHQSATIEMGIVLYFEVNYGDLERN